MIINDLTGPALLPFDFSAYSIDVLQRSLKMIRDKSKIRLVHVAQLTTVQFYGHGWDTISDEKVREGVDMSFRKQVEQHPENANLTIKTLLGDPGTQICEYAQQIEAEIILMSSRGRTGLHKFLLGSVAERVMQKAPCPVLLIRNELETDQTNSA
ncbi:MAG: universal stress protein [Pirellulaceae bacterium]